MSTENKFLSSLSYFSIFFLPIIFPIIVMVLTSNVQYAPAHRHAVAAFWLHLIPTILLPLAFGLGILATARSFSGNQFPTSSLVMFLIVGLMGIAALALFIYNIYKGVKIWVE
ncbi:hypothetical protein PS403_03490 [Pediococcus acidilactici]